MNLTEFDYLLPQELIANYPLEKRDEARLFCVDRKSKKMEHHVFLDLSLKLIPGDVLVLNNTKVIPARFFALKKETGAVVELFLSKEIKTTDYELWKKENGEVASEEAIQKVLRWQVMVKPAKRFKKNDRLFFKTDAVVGNSFARLVENATATLAPTDRLVDVFLTESKETFFEQFGKMPLPPYIKRQATEQDREDYQTVFAEKEGAVAAPTAGLHFTEELLQILKERGVEVLETTLHVGYGTFQPVKVTNLKEHQMHAETLELDEKTASRIRLAKKEGRRVVACGTTVVRALESCVDQEGNVQAQKKETDIFIYPPFQFRVVDVLITNFHLPKSSLMMLVAAFGGLELIMEAYKKAVEKKYRFFSYGDAMLIE